MTYQLSGIVDDFFGIFSDSKKTDEAIKNASDNTKSYISSYQENASNILLSNKEQADALVKNIKSVSFIAGFSAVIIFLLLSRSKK